MTPPPPAPSLPEITNQEFKAVQRFIYAAAGISLSDAKKPLVTSRLAKRLRACGLADYDAYLKRVQADSVERQWAIDLLTTNETYFFREQSHFDFMCSDVLPRHQRDHTFRAWSAASSSGEEAYSIAMVLDDALGQAPWEVVGTDISTQVLERCSQARYPMERAQLIPGYYLRSYCLKGTGPEDGFLRVNKSLRQHLRFLHANLNSDLPALGEFDLIFLRNVMIYFEAATRHCLIQRLVRHLRPGGWLFIGHAEFLHGFDDQLRLVSPSIYQKP